jgi:hypothetical protein
VAIARRASPRISLTSAIPATVRRGDQVSLAGRTVRAPRHGWVVLEGSRSGPWSVLARARPARRGRFTLLWNVPPSAPTGPLSLRIALVSGRRTLAHTRAVQSAVGPAATGCAPPSPPPQPLPAGDGWITGGEIFQGGPFPGLHNCTQHSYTVNAEDTSGRTLASQQVAGGHSYTLVVPAGSYTLSAGFCRGQATVQAGRQTQADTYCDVP